MTLWGGEGLGSGLRVGEGPQRPEDGAGTLGLVTGCLSRGPRARDLRERVLGEGSQAPG